MRLFIAATSLLASASVCGTTLDFDDLSPASGVPLIYEGYVFEGFIDNAPQPDWNFPAGVEPYNDGSALSCVPTTNYWLESNCGISMEHSSGDLFSLHSLDMAYRDLFNGGTSAYASVIGYSASGGLVSATGFDLEPPLSGGVFEQRSFVFDSTWTNLARVEFKFQAVNSGGFAAGFVDNISVTAVPIPAAVWLFGSALAGLGWMRRKQTV